MRLRPKTAETAQTWPFPVQASRDRAPSVICNCQQDAIGPLITRHKRNAETRDRISVALGELRNIHNSNSLIKGGHATECCKLVAKFLQLAAARPFDPTCRYALPVTCSESAHVRRTLLTAVGSGGDTSRASLYFSCQCAGLEGNLLRFAPFRDE